MSLLLAPYNTAMRLGQGFNSFTQQICIDDAVIIDPGRPENAITNDGLTMRELRALMNVSNKNMPFIKDKPSPMDMDPRITVPPDYSSEEESELGSDSDSDNGSDTGSAGDSSPKKPRVTKPKITKPKIPDFTGDGDGESNSKKNKNKKLTDGDDDNKPPGSPVPGSPVPGSPVPGSPVARSPVPGSPVPGSPVPGSPVPGSPVARSPVPGSPVPGSPVPGSGDESPVDAKKLRQQLEARKAALEKEKKAAAAKDSEEEPSRKKHRERAEKDEKKRFRRAQRRAREAATIKPYTKKEMEEWSQRKSKPDESLLEKAKREKKAYSYSPGSARGPSQIVTYKSQFIEKLSDITDDMNISGALSIKYGTIGGSGRGAFIDSDKVKDSDLNFYISVKVVNQTINMKDALIYQPLNTVTASDFNKVFGDSFISGFIEGGEFNAVVSMKVLNKEKMTKIKAQAKIALTVGAAEIGAEAAVNIAKENISNHTETTIMVSWSGGGFIKPIDEPWNISSLMDAAARFPDLCAITPQRTYAILTKYESLRSFVKLKPKAYTKMQYENAQIYTNILMETYMDYKSIIKNITSMIFDVENSIKKFAKPAKVEEDTESGSGSSGSSKKKKPDRVKSVYDRSKFESSIVGLDDARRAARFQMVLLVNEVDDVTGDPTLATKIEREEPFQSPIVFRSRLPKLVANVVEGDPFGGETGGIIPIVTSYPPLCPTESELMDEERLELKKIVDAQPDIAACFSLSAPVGSTTEAETFNNLDFLKWSFLLSSVRVYIGKSAVVCIEATYTNGLKVSYGNHAANSSLQSLSGLGKSERIIACSIETGEPVNKPSVDPEEGGSMAPPHDFQRITALRLYTNRGRTVVAQAEGWKEAARDRKGKRGGVEYEKLTLKHYDPPFEKGFIKGFWGRQDDSITDDERNGIWRLGFIWGNEQEPPKPQTKRKDPKEKDPKEKDEDKE
ncbi:hypothetical protein TWF718_009215 [Orbilia javanica]|uniref:Uncharacterized protein n=1 Tax=Orbilia javanica TaxID=47235 RepID=A0AAN8MP53_9PEZI